MEDNQRPAMDEPQKAAQGDTLRPLLGRVSWPLLGRVLRVLAPRGDRETWSIGFGRWFSIYPMGWYMSGGRSWRQWYYLTGNRKGQRPHPGGLLWLEPDDE